MKTYDVVIIGAGTSGLTARREVAKVTDNYVVIDDGPLGTTCARVGCMPSKVFIQVANDFGRRKHFPDQGIRGGDNLSVNSAQVMKHVRSLRDRFVKGVKNPMQDWQDKLIRGRAEFVDAHRLLVNGDQIKANNIIVAAGSRPVIPEPFAEYRDHLVTTDEFFELSELPTSMAVIGLGVIGIELGQALNKLGVKTVGVTIGDAIGGLTDPEIKKYVANKFQSEFPIYFNGTKPSGISAEGKLQLEIDGKIHEVDKALLAVGRRHNLDRLKIENLGVELGKNGVPKINPNTMKVVDAPHVFLPGDINGDRPILHEAADEGIIAGHNAVLEETCFKRRVPLGITFSDPNIAFVGRTYKNLVDDNVDFVTGAVTFEGQGRSIVKLQEQGLLHVYADKKTGRLLGAEMQAPDGEHLAHLISWAISMELTVREAITLPFYHPVVEEGLRTALRGAAVQIRGQAEGELYRCEDPPIR